MRKKIIIAFVIYLILLVAAKSFYIQSKIMTVSDFVLIGISLVVPFIFAFQYGRNPFSLKLFGKGLFTGGLVSIAYNLFELFIIKKILISGCSDACGIGNVLIGFLNIFFMFVGLLMWRIKAFIEARSNHSLS